ncbi:hypothetical protein PM082_004559 [Marasmius tenuissimus]|nr:hypothetical protein PM082_004559 [Marasmius tenuissimus]
MFQAVLKKLENTKPQVRVNSTRRVTMHRRWTRDEHKGIWEPPTSEPHDQRSGAISEMLRPHLGLTRPTDQCSQNVVARNLDAENLESLTEASSTFASGVFRNTERRSSAAKGPTARNDNKQKNPNHRGGRGDEGKEVH